MTQWYAACSCFGWWCYIILMPPELSDGGVLFSPDGCRVTAAGAQRFSYWLEYHPSLGTFVRPHHLQQGNLLCGTIINQSVQCHCSFSWNTGMSLFSFSPGKAQCFCFSPNAAWCNIDASTADSRQVLYLWQSATWDREVFVLFMVIGGGCLSHVRPLSIMIAG